MARVPSGARACAEIGPKTGVAGSALHKKHSACQFRSLTNDPVGCRRTRAREDVASLAYLATRGASVRCHRRAATRFQTCARAPLEALSVRASEGSPRRRRVPPNAPAGRLGRLHGAVPKCLTFCSGRKARETRWHGAFWPDTASGSGQAGGRFSRRDVRHGEGTRPPVANHEGSRRPLVRSTSLGSLLSR